MNFLWGAEGILQSLRLCPVAPFAGRRIRSERPLQDQEKKIAFLQSQLGKAAAPPDEWFWL